MFSYIININILTKPYADISKESNHEIEDEVLLSMGTIFRCESVEYLINGDFWHVKMIMIDGDNDNDVDHDSKRQILNDIQQKPILLMLGKFVLETSHNSDKAERYYRMFLESEIMSPWDKCEAYVALGLMCKNKGQYEIAIEYFETIIDICKIHSIENEHMNREYMTLSYVNIAEIYTITDFQKAIKTLNTIIELHLYSPIELAKVYNMLGDIYRTRTTLCKIALKYYRLAHANDSKNQKYIQNIELIRQEINRPSEFLNEFLCILIFFTIAFFAWFILHKSWPQWFQETSSTIKMIFISYSITFTLKYLITIFDKRAIFNFKFSQYILTIWTWLMNYYLIFSNFYHLLRINRYISLLNALNICLFLDNKRFYFLIYLLLFNPTFMSYYVMIIICLHRSYWIFYHQDKLNLRDPAQIFHDGRFSFSLWIQSCKEFLF
ncbi:unnamed protein product [Rotaria sp. Silwood2]|nr:unnamed protein product [Rotaria sp. Silwood2]CAF4298555.1 unnamed protein product [Rotaria sp. Silwood2]